jgi:hypothetical protein
LPNQSLIIQLLDKDENHLAFIGCGHNENVPLYNSDNDRELSNFYEFISNLESSALSEYFKVDNELESKVSWVTAIFITDKNSQIIYETKPI